jgi:hypothetical protein
MVWAVATLGAAVGGRAVGVRRSVATRPATWHPRSPGRSAEADVRVSRSVPWEPSAGLGLVVSVVVCDGCGCRWVGPARRRLGAECDQPSAFRPCQAGTELFLLVGRDLYEPVEHAPTWSVSRRARTRRSAGPPLQQASAFQLVDQRHHATAVEKYLHAFPRACRGGGAQQLDRAGFGAKGASRPSIAEPNGSSLVRRTRPREPQMGPREPRGRTAEWDHRGTRGKPGTEGSGFGMFYPGNSYKP